MRKSRIRLAWVGMIAGFICCPFGWTSHELGMTSAEAAGLSTGWQGGPPHAWLLAADADQHEDNSGLWDESAPTGGKAPSDNAGQKSEDIWNEPGGAKGQTGASEGSLWGKDQGTGSLLIKKKNPFKIVGLIRNKLDIFDHKGSQFQDTLQNHSQVQLGFKYVPSDTFNMEVSAQADYFAYHREGDWHDDSSLWVYNAYLNWSGRGYNLRVGNQIVRWGKTDGYSPLDNVNPEDYRDGIAGRREDRKRPIPMVNLNLYFGNLSLQGLYIPVFISSTVDLTGTNWALFDHADQEIHGYRLMEEDPSHTFNNGGAGLRLADTFGDVDVAVSWLYSRAYLPFPESMKLPPGVTVPSDAKLTDLLQLSRLTGQTVRLSHDRQNIFGLSMETTVGDFGVRGDFAYIHKSPFLTQSLQRLDKPECQAMVGIDYSGAHGWYTNLQFLQTLIIGYDRHLLWAREDRSAVNGTVSKEFMNGNLKPECRFYYDFAGDASMLNPKVIVKFWEPLIFEVGAELFDGSPATPLGIYGVNDLVYASAEYRF